MMKRRLLFSFLLLIAVCGFATAQKSDTVQKHYNKKDLKPLTMLDGKIYASDFDFTKINPKNIYDVEIIKKDKGIALLGNAGENGLLVIRTRKYHLTDTLKKTNPLGLRKNDTAMFILDGMVSDAKLNDLVPSDIFAIHIVTQEQLSHSQIFPNRPWRDIIVVNTKAAIVRSYQKKLSKLSKKYKLHLISDYNDDSKIVFKINGRPYRSTNYDGLKALDDLKEDNLKKVIFSKTNKVISGSLTATVVITTKII